MQEICSCDGQRCNGILLAIGIRLECGGQQDKQCRELLGHMAASKAIQGICKRAFWTISKSKLAHSNYVYNVIRASDMRDRGARVFVSPLGKWISIGGRIPVATSKAICNVCGGVPLKILISFGAAFMWQPARQYRGFVSEHFGQ